MQQKSYVALSLECPKQPTMKSLSIWQVGLFLLGLVGSVFHLWLASVMRLSSPIGAYFAIAGVLFLVGSVFVLIHGFGFLFKLGAGGLIALSAIDNGLLYYTRTFGAGFVFRLFPSSATFRRPPTNATISGRPLGGPPPGAGAPWSVSWIPPGAVQFFVLQSVIIIIAAVALWRARSLTRQTALPTAGSTPTPSNA
jgi:hypothetical protein